MTAPSLTLLDVSLNGKRLQTGELTLQTLLVAEGYELKTAFACAINSTFVPRSQWATRELQAGDRIDVVTPITGG